MRRSHSFLVVTLVCSGVMCVLGSAVRAHEIGTTRVNVVFEGGQTYHGEVVTDAVSLVEKLEASNGQTPSSTSDPSVLRQQLMAFDETFRRRLNVVFDGSAVRPLISYDVAPAVDVASPALATIRLTGEVPQGARHFSWMYGWTFASYALAVRSSASDSGVTEWLEGNETSTLFPLTAPLAQVGRAGIAWRYCVLGFTHIVPHGLDHMLFVIGLFLLAGGARAVLWQVSAFTVAHSITLGLSIYGWIGVSPAIVEPLIALSIAYVAIENLFLSELKSWRVALVFAFGLLHGMGFAGALQELGLPRSEFVTALVTFNLGVEAGQLSVIGGAFLLVGWQWSPRTWYRRRIVVPASVLIACTAAYWTLERLRF